MLMPLGPSQREWLTGVVAGLTALSDNRWMMPSADLTAVLGELAGVIERCVPGAVAEMGCAAGKTSLRLAALLRLLGEGPGRPLHLYDTFAGFPEPTAEDEQNANWREREAPHLHYPEGGPAALFRQWGDGLAVPVVHAGLFREVGPHPKQIAFTLVDCDTHDSIRTALRIVWPRLAPGGTVMIHDYGNPTWPGAKLAVDTFFAQRQPEVERWEIRNETLLTVTRRAT
jgi:O-methyltransferase